MFAIITVYFIEGFKLFKYIGLFIICTFALYGGVIKTPVLTVDNEAQTATIRLDKVDVGVSGFISHRHSKTNASILRNVLVESYDKVSKVAVLKMQAFNQLRQNSLPQGEWKVEVGDMAILAFGYTRGLLIAPNEDIYYRITKAVQQTQWLHPDIFTTILAFNGHATPLKEDFNKMNIATSVGLVFFFLHQKLFTVDIKSLKILNISDAPLEQKNVKLPFYSRIEKIDADWWGEGTNEIESYEPYYCKLLMDNNPKNKELEKICSTHDIQINTGDGKWSLQNMYNILFQ